MTLSIIYLGFLLGFIVNPKTELNQLSLNEIGDFLAGFVGPVALMWIVFGYFQQNNAIEIQAKELKAAVDQHQAQVTATSALVDHELRRARIDYYRLVSEASSKIEHCKLLLHGDLESEETKSRSTAMLTPPFGSNMAEIGRAHHKALVEMAKRLRASIGLTESNAKVIETREILEKVLTETSEKQAQFEKEIEDYAKINFDTLEKRFSQIVVHIGKTEAIYDRIKLYMQVERAKKATEALQRSNSENENSSPDDGSA